VDGFKELIEHFNDHHSEILGIHMIKLNSTNG
jgi:hypothetical protein